MDILPPVTGPRNHLLPQLATVTQVKHPLHYCARCKTSHKIARDSRKMYWPEEIVRICILQHGITKCDHDCKPSHGTMAKICLGSKSSSYT